MWMQSLASTSSGNCLQSGSTSWLPITLHKTHLYICATIKIICISGWRNCRELDNSCNVWIVLIISHLVISSWSSVNLSMMLLVKVWIWWFWTILNSQYSTRILVLWIIQASYVSHGCGCWSFICVLLLLYEKQMLWYTTIVSTICYNIAYR